MLKTRIKPAGPHRRSSIVYGLYNALVGCF